MLFQIAIAAVTLAALPSPKESLGVFGQWGAFRDSGGSRCYAIAQSEDTSARSDFQSFASVGTWPRRNVRGQFHIRLSRELANAPNVRVAIGSERFSLTAGDADAWTADASDDASIVAAMRSAARMTVSATDKRGNRFIDRYSLSGAATAMDAATVGCASRGRGRRR